MRKRHIAAVTFALAATWISTATAGAATDIGDNCVTNAAPANQTFVLKSSAGILPVTPASSGVVTKWQISTPAIGVSLPLKLKVLTPGAGPNDFKVDAESAVESIPMGTTNNAFNARLPIQAGDRLGLISTVGTPVCTAQPAGSTVASIPGDVPVGNTATFAENATTALPVVATVEADGDGDGFGDESQDGCPQSAQIQFPCPVIGLDLFSVPGKGSLSLLVTASNEATVSVSGTAKVPKAKGGKGKRAKQTVDLSAAARLVVPGDLVVFKVKYPKSLKQALAALPAKKSIKVSLSASAPNIVGDPALAKSSAKVPGTG